MTLTTAEIKSVVKDLAPRIASGKIVRIDQPDSHHLIFHIHRNQKRYWLQIVAEASASRLHLLTHRPDKSKSEGGFCNVLGQHLIDSIITELRQVENDRVVILEAQQRDALLDSSKVYLIAELIGTGSNIILIDENDTVLGALHTEDSSRRTIQPGRTYEPLPAPPVDVERASKNRFKDAWNVDDPLSLSRAIEEYYTEREFQENLEKRRTALLSRVEQQIERLNGRRHKLDEELDKAKNADELKRDGELLKIALPNIERGQKKVVVQDFFEPDNPAREIELDPKLSGQENIQKYFDEYKRRRDSYEHVTARIEATHREVEQLQRAQTHIQSADSIEVIEEMKEKLQSGGLLPPEGQPSRKQKEQTGGPRQFISHDGLDILVARNKKQNHELTFSISRGNDYWMHLLGWPGPHVIIRKPRNGEVPRSTLIDAAHLAVYFSKIRGTDYAEVVYTQRKHVNPIKGAEPGRVRYSNENTMRIQFSKNRMKRLLNEKDSI
ncbi:MAG: Rqc2 family fibronectin-binding protein [Planctomycetota bacterium]